jgi:bisanhydrobacterioruberin hydratase
MKIFHDRAEGYSIIFLVVSFVLGTTLHLIPILRPLIVKFTELYLFLANSLVFAFGLLNNHRKLSAFTFWGILTILFLFLIQVIGINTGAIYGLYWFNDTLSTQFANVPIIITFNWAMLILASYGTISKFVKNRYVRALISSLLIVLLDLFMEPVAMKLNYWSWQSNSVPIQNYIAWFLLSYVFSTFLAVFKIHARSALFRFYFITQLLFFIILKFFL